MFVGFMALVLLGVNSANGSGCTDKTMDLALQSSPSGVLQKPHSVVWIPAPATGMTAEVYVPGFSSEPFVTDQDFSERLAKDLGNYLRKRLAEHYRRSLRPGLFRAWKVAENLVASEYAHELYILDGSGNLAFHLRIFEAPFSRQGRVNLPAEILEMVMGDGRKTEVASLAEAFRTLSLINPLRSGHSVFELGQYLVDAQESMEAAQIKELAARFLLDVFLRGKGESLFVFVPATPAHGRLYARDFGFQQRDAGFGRWVRGSDLSSGLQKLVERSSVLPAGGGR